MSAAAVSRLDGVDPAAFALNGSDRLSNLFVPVRGMSRAMLAVAVASGALHLALLATAIVTSRAPLLIPETQETPVEVVQEVPKATPPKPASKAPTLAPLRTAGAEPAKSPEPVKPPEPTPPPPREAPKAEAPKAAPPMSETAKPAVASESVKAVTEEREALLKELAALRAQEAKLDTATQDTAKPDAPAASPARPAPTLGIGALPHSFQAVALPSTSDGAGEAMGYREIVFSQLAKAKGLGGQMGQVGTSGVAFSIDAAGVLLHAEIVHKSGVAALDREAIDIVRRAAPFPPPPQGAQRSFVANVNFVAQDSK